MTKRSKKDEVDLLEGFDFASVFEGEIKGPEALIPDSAMQHKLASNPDQTGTKLASNPDQTGTKLASNPDQIHDQKRPSGEKPTSQPAPQPASNLDQTSIKLAPKASLDGLSGLQRNALIFVYESCRFSGGKISPPITMSNLSEFIKTTVAAARVAVQRIEKKGYVERSEHKSGRGGWTKYKLPDDVYGQLLLRETRIKLAPNLDQTSIKLAPEPTSQPAPSPPSSSRDLNIKESTSTEQPDFSAIDLTSVQGFGITASVLARCVELYPNLKPEQLEVLAIRFGEFAKDPKNKVQNARGFFISLAEQASKGQVPLDHIETPDERLMRLFVQRQKEEMTRKVDFEREAQDVDLARWLESLTAEAKLALVPETSILKAGTAAHAAMLRSYFTEKIWPKRRKQILEGDASL